MSGLGDGERVTSDGFVICEDFIHLSLGAGKVDKIF